MKKEYLTLEDRKIMRAKSKSMGLMYLTVFIVGGMGWWIYQEYFADEKYTIGSIFFLVVSVLAMFIGWVIHSLEEWNHYKWVIEGKIQKKQEHSNTDDTYYTFKIKNQSVTISKEDYNGFRVGQKIKVEQTATTKSTIRITII